MKTEYEYIYFEQSPHPGKTTRWNCRNRKNHSMLGDVVWYGAWRQYCFSPLSDTVFSAGCLADIQEFITQLMDERKAKP